MIFTNLRNRTEFSFGHATGRIANVLAAQDPSAKAAGICDRSGTWGHVKWAKACKAKGIKPVFGVELAVVKDMEAREGQHTTWMSFIARNNDGLREIYELTTLATEKFYYTPRIDYGMVRQVCKNGNVIVLSGSNPHWVLLPKKLKNFYVELNQLSDRNIAKEALAAGYNRLVATSDNLYARPTDILPHQVMLGDRYSMRTAPGQILDQWSFPDIWPHCEKAVQLASNLADDCTAELPTARMVKPKVKMTLEKMCIAGAKELKVDLADPVYKARLKRELDLIKAKKFEDYFYVVADMVNFAKKNMLVGDGRGSSCGSLVCYLIGITGIDPIPFGLLFERFIDINRNDLPDIDIDFQDNKREMVFDYLREKYGTDNVSRIGTVNLFKAKNTIIDACRVMKIPLWEINDFKNSIVERREGDDRAFKCVEDAFNETAIGRKTLAEFPELEVAAQVEGAARHTGVHAAGILVTADPITNYCAVNMQTGAAMLDKKDAEALNLLKIDALGLRTLSVLADVLEGVKWTPAALSTYPLDDAMAWKPMNAGKFTGIFQFEGYALRGLTAKITVDCFDDLVSLTALARPGPMDSGCTADYIKRKAGQAKVTYVHPLMEEITKDTFGVIVYQEQVMKTLRVVGAMSWDDVTAIRKLMAKSQGSEAIDKEWPKFWEGAKKQGVKEDIAQILWDQIKTHGAYSFNKSHAVAYGKMSYQCALLKEKFPLEFAVANLRNAKDDEQSVRILRELVREGYKFKPYDAEVSGLNWVVKDGMLIGGLTAITGVGPKKAAVLMRKRAEKLPYTAAEERLLTQGKTPWDSIFECNDKWQHVKDNPRKYNIESQIVDLNTITEDEESTVVFIAKMTDKEVRDHNEPKLVERRGSKMDGDTLFLMMNVEDDTDAIRVMVPRKVFAAYKAVLMDESKNGDWFIFKGTSEKGWRSVTVQRIKKLTGNPDFYRVRGKAPVDDESDPEIEVNGKIALDVAKASMKKLVDFYNEHSGSPVMITKFVSKEKAREAVTTLIAANNEIFERKNK